MKTIDKPLSEIRPYEKNPRRNDAAVDAVAASIREFGFRVPIVIDKAGVIVAGHTRYKAAQKLGLASVPCVVASDLSPKQVKAFRLADNKTAELATWDFDLLGEEIEELAGDFDMEDFGFSAFADETFADEGGDGTSADETSGDESSGDGIHARIGEYQFAITSDEYFALLAQIRKARGYDKAAILEGLKEKLLCDL